MPIMNSKLSSAEKSSLKSFHDNNGIYIAEVMDTRSPNKNGDIKVWILNSGTEKGNPINWVVAHSANSIGSTLFENVMKLDSFAYQSTSYGVWNTVPYVGNYVFIFYPHTTDVNTTPYWFGAPNFTANSMIPGISYNLETTNYQAVCDKPTKTYSINNPSVFYPLQNGLVSQGLDNDRLRGISTASTTRDTPSRCYGFLSPLGNQFVIDDGWSLGDSNINWVNDPRVNDNDNQEKDDYGAYHSKKNWIASVDKGDKDNKLNRFHGGFRFRTRNGTQLLILDVGNIYMINKDGTSWVELSEDGYIDCYSQKGISAASEGNINLHATKINIEAEDTITLNGKKGIILNTSGNINADCSVLCVSKKVSTPTLVSSSANINSLSSGSANLTGVFSGTLQGTCFYATYAGMVPTEQPMPEIPDAEVNDVEYPTYYDVEKEVNLGTTSSVTSRIPTHEPWAGHDKNDCIPLLQVKQVMKKEEKEVVNNTVPSNQIRR